MKNLISRKYSEWIYIPLIWIIILYYYYFSVYYAPIHFFAEGPFKVFLESRFIHLEIAISAIIIGVFHNISIRIISRPYFLKRPFGLLIVVYSLMQFLTIAILLGSIRIFYLFMDFDMFQYVKLISIHSRLRLFVSFVTFFMLSTLFVNFILLLNKKFGPGNLRKLFMGYYSYPREEEKIFLFLDMVGSTATAERLGHKKYSQLIKEVFHDMTEMILKYQAEVYQFVGDAVVLVWEPDTGLDKANCAHFFFEYDQVLKARSDYYLENYGVVPSFRGGMEMGTVITTEVGDIKREFAYHGDVLNTAARLQERCKQHKLNFLTSSKLAHIITGKNGYSATLVETIQLRGKKYTMDIYTLADKPAF